MAPSTCECYYQVVVCMQHAYSRIYVRTLCFVFLSEQTRAVLVYAGATRARVCVVQDTHCTYPYRRVGAVPARTCWLSRGRPWAEFESYTKQESRSLGAHSLSFVFFNCIRIADVCVCLPYSVRWQGMPLSCFFSLSALHVVSLT